MKIACATKYFYVTSKYSKRLKLGCDICKLQNQSTSEPVPIKVFFTAHRSYLSLLIIIGNYINVLNLFILIIKKKTILN